MTNLWTTAAGRAATKEAIYQIIRRRISRFFGRKFVVQYEAWVASGKTAFSFLNTLGNLNPYHDTEILNLYELLMTIGELPETVANLDVYVNGATGSDINGLGNSTTPFATVGRALEDLENTVIKHRVRILVANPSTPATYTYTESEWFLNHEISGDGSLAIIGVSVPEVAFATEALTAVSALGTGGLYQTAGLAGWGVNQWQGTWANPVDGPADKWAYPILHNTATVLTGGIYGTLPLVGNSIQGIRPAIKVNLNSLKIKTRCENRARTNALKSPVAIVNLELRMNGSSDRIAVFDIDGDEQNIWLDFLSVRFADGNFDDIKIKRAYVNFYEPRDTGIGLASLTSIANIGVLGDNAGVSFHRETKGLASSVMAFIDGSYVTHLTIPEYIYHRGTYPGTFLENCAFSGVLCYTGTYIETKENYLSNDGAAAYIYEMCKAKIRGDFIRAGLKCVVADQVSLFIGDAAQCDVAIAGYGLQAGAGTHCVIDGTLAAFVGTSGAVQFTAPNPDVVVAWPAAGAQNDDGLISATVTQNG